MSKPPAPSVHLIICHLSVRVFNKKKKKEEALRFGMTNAIALGAK